MDKAAREASRSPATPRRAVWTAGEEERRSGGERARWWATSWRRWAKLANRRGGSHGKSSSPTPAGPKISERVRVMESSAAAGEAAGDVIFGWRPLGSRWGTAEQQRYIDSSPPPFQQSQKTERTKNYIN